jgi:hypothetical protein
LRQEAFEGITQSPRIFKVQFDPALNHLIIFLICQERKKGEREREREKGGRANPDLRSMFFIKIFSLFMKLSRTFTL